MPTRRRLSRHLVIASLATAFFTGWTASAARSEAWDVVLWDPGEPLEGQVNVPLPCGGQMAFARVETPVEPGNPLSDRAVSLGSGETGTGYLDYYRVEHLRGGFVEGDRSFYFLAKYEVTRDQWAALMEDVCPSPNRSGARPMVGISWFDAVTFTRRLTEWLRANAADALPRQDSAWGYVRLPTEAEWEYAARGGAEVDRADFRAPLPPMETGVDDHAWFEGRDSAAGAFRPIGLKKPNPLGLHGMFGGVEEVVLEPFRLNNLGREHGQVGGFVTRGGSIRTPRGELRSALRAEYAYFDAYDGQALALETFGLRPAISVPVNTSLQRTTMIRDIWIERSSAEPDRPNDPLAVIDRLTERQTDQRLVDELGFVRGAIVSDRKARRDAAKRSIRLSLLNGAVLMRWLAQERAGIDRLETVNRVLEGVLERERAKLGKSGEDASERFRQGVERNTRQLEANRLKIDRSRAAFDLAASAYLGALVDLAERRDAEAVTDQANQLIVELEEREQSRLVPTVQKFVRNIRRRSNEPERPREALIDDAVGN